MASVTLPDLHFAPIDSITANIAISGLVGFIAPWITAFFNKRRFSDTKRIMISIIVSLILGIIECLITNQFKNITNVMVAGIIIWNTSQIVYKNVAMKLGIRSFEQATTPANQRVIESPPLSTSSTLEATAQVIKTVIEQPHAVVEQMANTPMPVPIEHIAEHIEEHIEEHAKIYTTDEVNDLILRLLNDGDNKNGKRQSNGD